MEKIYQVRHGYDSSDMDVVSTHSTISGASVAATLLMLRKFKSTDGMYSPIDPNVCWNGELPYWDWDNGRVQVFEEEIQP